MSDQTRRNWVLAIGQTLVAINLTPRLGLAAESPGELPPGVYLPSRDHLGHALMSSERYRPIPAGCPTDYVRPRQGPYAPLFFSRDEFPVVVRLVELMLGDNKVSEEVAEWIDVYVSEADDVGEAEAQVDPLYRALAAAYYGSRHKDKKNQNAASICREGLAWVGRAANPTAFLNLDTERQIAILHSISDEGKHPENAGTRFFTLLKTQVIRGFYTSQVGLKELDFKGNGYYATSPGCGRQS